MVMRGRFAPSPTGELHLGHARTALLAWLQVREAGGQFVLRLEDLDAGRVRSGSSDGILRDLEWLGLNWDEGWDIGGRYAPYTQSERLGLYADAALRLETYPCTCSRLEVLHAASAPHGTELRYLGTCRGGVTHVERRTALRWKVPDLEVRVTDGIAGEITENVSQTVGDFVIRRNDGAWAYQLACVVDDIDMGITDVLRGADLLGSTARQALLFDALGASQPRFWHVPLLTDKNGARLAKRSGAASLRQMREGGADPKALTRDLALGLGWKVAALCQPQDLLGQWQSWLESIASGR